MDNIVISSDRDTLRSFYDIQNEVLTSLNSQIKAIKGCYVEITTINHNQYKRTYRGFVKGYVKGDDSLYLEYYPMTKDNVRSETHESVLIGSDYIVDFKKID